ncbi:hypothetical protein ABZ619_39180 [Streptomyces sp. NPDC007851]|uniref:hypothetical protein n=1 Tax=Streptomyces sp. NPDC007851 TaxID=3155008 RepID=UPI0033DDBF35
MLTSTLTATADHLLDMAFHFERHGVWTGGPNFASHTGRRHDVPAGAYRAVAGHLPRIFTVPTDAATADARRYIENTPAAMEILHVIADHMTKAWPDLDWTDDPIDRLSNWPNLLGVTPGLIAQTLRDIAHTLDLAATAPAAA